MYSFRVVVVVAPPVWWMKIYRDEWYFGCSSINGHVAADAAAAKLSSDARN